MIPATTAPYPPHPCRSLLLRPFLLLFLTLIPPILRRRERFLRRAGPLTRPLLWFTPTATGGSPSAAETSAPSTGTPSPKRLLDAALPPPSSAATRSRSSVSLAYPGRFSSSWDLFPLLDSMEIVASGSNHDAEIADVARFRVKALPDRSAVPQGIVLNKYGKREDDNSSPNLDYEGELGMKGVDYQNLVTTAFGSKSYAKAHGGNRNLTAPGFRSKNYDRIDEYFDAKLNHSNHSDNYKMIEIVDFIQEYPVIN